MNTRFLGTIFLTSSTIVLLNGLRAIAQGIEPYADTWGSVAYFLWGIGGVCGILGLIRLNALGNNPLARAIGFLPLLGFAAFILGEGLRLAGFINLNDVLYNTLIGFAWIAVLAGMLVVGILTIAAKRWSGWPRFVPLLTAVMFPISLAIGQAIQNMYISSILGWLPWILLGYLIATMQSEPALQVVP
jgi:hypothetical protein